MLAWVGIVFAVLLLAGCLADALFGATAEALANPVPIKTLDPFLREVDAANDEPSTAWSSEVRATLPSEPAIDLQRIAA